MYEHHYGFYEKPFEVAPDPKYLFLNSNYKELLASLIYGVTERKGFIAIVGEVGTGKTLMINCLKERLERGVKVATIVVSDLTFKQMLMMILYDFGIAKIGKEFSKAEALQRLKNYAEEQMHNGGNVLIIIDEAQNLKDEAIENLRMLSNFETPKNKLIQIVISGQPELDKKLSRPKCRQLVQRISLKRYSSNLSEEDVCQYIQHRLSVAKYAGKDLFTETARKLIWNYSNGIPRKINILCDNLLLVGYGLQKKEINEEIVNEVVKDLCWQTEKAQSG